MNYFTSSFNCQVVNQTRALLLGTLAGDGEAQQTKAQPSTLSGALAARARNTVSTHKLMSCYLHFLVLLLHMFITHKVKLSVHVMLPCLIHILFSFFLFKVLYDHVVICSKEMGRGMQL